MSNEPIKKVGKWELAGRLTRGLRSDVKQELTVVLRQIGSQGEKRMKTYVRNQEGNSAKGDFKWAALNEAYKSYKVKHGKSNKTLISSSSMFQSITSIAVYPKVYIGIKRGVKNKDGEDLVLIGAVMEFGSQERNIPARPFIRPVTDELMKEVTENNLIGRRLINHLRKKYNF